MGNISLQFAVQPPTIVRLNTTLEPPLAVKLVVNPSPVHSPHAMNGYPRHPNTDLCRIWAFASLMTTNGEVLSESLTGKLAESAHGFNEDFDADAAGYFLFEDLVIRRVGEFVVRVTLMRMDTEGDRSAVGVDQVESRLVVVEDADVDHRVPSPSEQGFLNSVSDQYDSY